MNDLFLRCTSRGRSCLYLLRPLGTVEDRRWVNGKNPSAGRGAKHFWVPACGNYEEIFMKRRLGSRPPTTAPAYNMLGQAARE